MKKRYLKWLDKNVDDLSNKTFLITGCNSGIGFCVAKYLCYKKANIIMACRNIAKANDAKDLILKNIPSANIKVMKLDVSSIKSINSFIDEYKNKKIDIDVFINNAGAFHLKKSLTKDKFETIMATNYLGTYLLTNKIYSLLNKQKETRIVFTTSIAHRWGKINYDDFFSLKKYKHIKVYANSKLALTKYFVYLSENTDKNVKIIASHPGITATNLLNPNKGGTSKLFAAIGNAFLKIFVHSADKAALSTILAATKKDVNNQDLYGPKGLYGISGYPVLQRVSKKALVDNDKLINFTETLLKNTQ